MANEHIINNNLIISGSVTSSVGFAGDGSGLTNITSTSEWDGSRNGDSSITGSLVISGSSASVNLLNAGKGVSGSFSGSFDGDGSGLTNVNPFPFSGTAVISGSLTVSGSAVDAVDFQGIDNIRGGLFSGSFTGDGSQLTNLNINGTQASGSNLSGSFSGSFQGDGSGLSNLPSQEWDGSRSGDSSITGSLIVSGSNITVDLKGDTTLDENILISNTGDSTSIGIGSGSLQETTQTRNSIAIGIEAGNLLTSGSSNIYIGNEAGETAVQTVGDTAIGHQALQATTGIDTGDGSNNSCNTAVGFQALKANTQGEKGTAIGANALASNTTGLCNTAVGHEAGCNNTTGIKNVAIGDVSLLCTTTASHNTAVGNCSGYRLEGSDNTAIGRDALRGNGDITGGTNTALGSLAGSCISGDSDGNVYIGYKAGPSTGTVESNQLYINNNSGTPLIKGNFSTSQVSFAGGVSGSFSGSFRGDGSGLTGLNTNATPELKYRVYITGSVSTAIKPVLGNNISNDLYSVVLGGANNRSTGDYSVLAGGLYNTASANYSLIGGGTRNNVSSSAVSSSILAGFDNTTNYTNSHIIGSGITADKANYTFVNNLDAEGTVSASIFSGSFVGSGAGLTGLPTGEWDGSRNGDSSITGSLILSGSNINLDVRGGISGSTKITIGSEHTNLGEVTSIAGGCCNCTSAASSCSFIGGGRCNSITGTQNVVVGGITNCLQGTFSSILGGAGNCIASSANHNSIIGGRLNTISGILGTPSHCNFIGGGQCNIIKQGSCHTSIINGCLNTGSADFGAILGGSNNTLEHNCSFIIGDSLTSTKACYTFMNNLDVAGTVSASVFSGSFVGNASGLSIAAGSDTQIQYNNNGQLGASGSFTFTNSDTLTIGDHSTSGVDGQIHFKEEDGSTTAVIINSGSHLSLYKTNLSSALKHSGTQWSFEGTTASTSTSTGAVVVKGGVGIAGDLFIGGNLTAEQYIVSSSVTHVTQSFSSGSTIFGDTLDDTHQFTGSLSVTGSIEASKGFVILTEVSESLNFQNDTEAAAGGVPLGGLYRNGNFIAIRLI